ncbi:hypothetical protein AALF15_12275 [Corynebacteriaceae bacterium 7-707]
MKAIEDAVRMTVRATKQHNDRTETKAAERVAALTKAAERVEAHQLWTAAAALCLSLLPAAAIVIGWLILGAGVLYAWEIATSDAELALRAWKMTLLGTLLLGMAFGTWHGVKWMSGYVGQWSKQWPSRKR